VSPPIPTPTSRISCQKTFHSHAKAAFFAPFRPARPREAGRPSPLKRRIDANPVYQYRMSFSRTIASNPTDGRFQWIWCVLSAALLSGCATTYDLKVDAIDNPEANHGVSYRIAHQNPEGGETDLRAKEAAEWVKTALSGKGLYEAESMESADMIIELEYGMEEPRTKMSTISTPIYAEVGGGIRYIQVATRDKSGNVTYKPVAVREPTSREYVGEQESVIVQTVYEKYMRISARQNPKDDETDGYGAQVWSVYVTNEDERDDLRKYLPVMASAAIEFIGENSETQQEVRLKDTDDVVTFVKKGL